MIGTQAMVSYGLKMDGTWARTEPRRCGCCKQPSVFVDHDSPKSRVMVCDDCGAIEVISKGKTSWWYHAAQLPEKMAPAFLQSAYE